MLYAIAVLLLILWLLGLVTSYTIGGLIHVLLVIALVVVLLRLITDRRAADADMTKLADALAYARLTRVRHTASKTP